MKSITIKITFFIILIYFLISSFAFAGKDYVVRGYYRKDGTYVKPYRRTYSDRIRNNNYSTRGNINPYTGELGTHPRDGENFNIFRKFKRY